MWNHGRLVRLGAARPLLVVAIGCMSTAFSLGVGLAPGLVASALRADLGLRHWSLGLLVSLYFGASGLVSVSAGRVVDRWGARVSVAANLALTSVGACLAAVMGNYAGLVAAAVLSGAGFALSGVGTSVAVAQAVSERWRTAGMVVVNAGLPAVIALIAFLGPWIADRWQWEWVLAALAAGAAVAAVLAMGLLRDSRPERDEDSDVRLPKHFVWFPVASFLMLSGFSPTLTWAVSYFEEDLGSGALESGILIGWAAAVTFVVLIASSLVADRTDRETRIRLVAVLSRDSRLMWGVFGFVRQQVRLAMTLCLVRAGFGALILAGAALGVGVALVGVVGAMTIQTACVGTLLAAVADRAPRAVARATSLTMSGYFAGALVGPVAFGAFLDASGSYPWAWFIVCLVIVAAVMSLRFAGWIAPPRRGQNGESSS